MVADCALHTAGVEGNYGSDQRADLATDAQYANFELAIDWKASKGGNSGFTYGVVEEPRYKAAWETGPEYQFIDDVGWPGKLEEWQKAGADYAMHVPNDKKRLMPVGEWNTQEIVCKGRQVKITLNGVVIVDANLDDIGEKTMDGHAHPGLARTKGHIGFLGHGSRVEFRNIRIKEL